MQISTIRAMLNKTSKNFPSHIGGYVCPLFSAIWGVACVLIVKLIYPFTDKLVSFLPIFNGISE